MFGLQAGVAELADATDLGKLECISGKLDM